MSKGQTLDVGAWVREQLAMLLGIAPQEIDFARTLGDYGLDSFDLMVIAGDAEEALGMEIDPEPFFPPPVIGEIVAMLEKLRAAASSAGG